LKITQKRHPDAAALISHIVFAHVYRSIISDGASATALWIAGFATHCDRI